MSSSLSCSNSTVNRLFTVTTTTTTTTEEEEDILVCRPLIN